MTPRDDAPHLLRRLRREAADALELVLLPAAAALLPWRVGYRLLHRLARWQRLYAPTVDTAWRQVRGVLSALPGDSGGDDWRHRRRLTTLVDHADLYLSWTRGGGWMQHHLRLLGQWPAAGEAALMITLHWGAGLWALRHAGARGLAPLALVAPVYEAAFRGRSVLYRYVLARNAEVRRALRQTPLQVHRSLRPVVTALRAGRMVIVAADVPADSVAAAVDTTLAGRAVRVPSALLRLAVAERVPVGLFTTTVDWASGQRLLEIVPLGTFDSVQSLADAIYARLDACIAADSAAWHLWSEWPRFEAR